MTEVSYKELVNPSFATVTIIPAVLAQLSATFPGVPQKFWSSLDENQSVLITHASPTHGQTNYTVLNNTPSMSDLNDRVASFFDWFADSQEELGHDISALMHDNAWDLYESV